MRHLYRVLEAIAARIPMDERADPLSLVNAVLSILAKYEDAARRGGVHVHTMRRQLETAVTAYEKTKESAGAAEIAGAVDAMNRRAADAMKQIAEASIRLLREEKERAEANIAAMERELGRKTRSKRR